MFGSENSYLNVILTAKDHLTPVLNNATVATQRFAGISAKSLMATGLRLLGVTSAAYTTYKAIKYAVTSYSDFNAAMSEVSTLVDTSRVNMDEMTQSVLRFSSATGVGATQAAKALYQTISAGVDASRAMDMLAVAEKTALGGVASLTDSVDLLTNILNAYHLSTDKAIDVSDKMFIAVKEGKTTIPELAHSLGMLAPIASQAGVSVGEMAAATAELTKGGLNTSESVTGLRQLINSIIAPSSEAAKYAHKLGLAFSAKALQNQGLIKFLEQIKEKTKGDVDKITKLIPNVRALNAVLALTGSGYEDLVRINSEMNDSFGATDEAASKMRNTFKYQAQLAGTHVKNAFISLGNTIAFVLKPALQAFNGLFGGQKSDEEQRLKNLQSLLNAYDKLKDKAKLTADEEDRLQRIRNDIASLSPSLVSAYDNEGNAIKLNTDAVKALNMQYAIQSLNQIPKLIQGLNQVSNYHIGGNLVHTSALDAMDALTKKIQDLKKEIPSKGLTQVITVTPKYQERLALAAPGVGEENFTQIRYQAEAYVKNPQMHPEMKQWMESGDKAGQVMKIYVDYLQMLTSMQKKNVITQDDLTRAWRAFNDEGLKSVANIKAPREELNKLQKQLDDIASTYVKQATSILLAEQSMKTYVDSLPKEQQMAWLSRMKGLAEPAYNWGKKFMQTYTKGVVDGGGVLKPEIEKLLKSLSDYLELHSPAKAGPLSRLNQWGQKFIPTYLDGIKANTGKLIDGVKGFLRPLEGVLSKVGLHGMSSDVGRIIGKFSHIKSMVGNIVGSAKGIMQIYADDWIGGIITVVQKVVSLMKSTPEGRKALQKIFKVWEKIEKPVEKILDSVIKLLTPLVDLLGDILTPIASFLADAIVDPLNGLSNVIDNIVNAFQGVFGVIVKIGKAIFDYLVAPYKALFDMYSGLFDLIVGLFAGNSSKVSKSVQKIGKAIFDYFVGPLKQVYDIASGIFGWIGGLFGLNNNKANENIQKAKTASKIEESKSETKNENKNIHVGTVEIHSNASDPKEVADEVLRRLGLEAVAHG